MGCGGSCPSRVCESCRIPVVRRRPDCSVGLDVKVVVHQLAARVVRQRSGTGESRPGASPFPFYFSKHPRIFVLHPPFPRSYLQRMVLEVTAASSPFLPLASCLSLCLTLSYIIRFSRFTLSRRPIFVLIVVPTRFVLCPSPPPSQRKRSLPTCYTLCARPYLSRGETDAHTQVDDWRHTNTSPVICGERAAYIWYVSPSHHVYCI